MPGADLSAAPSLLRGPHFVLDIFTFMVDGEATGSAFSIHGIALLTVFRRQGGFFTPSTACHCARDMLEKLEGDRG